MLRRILIPLLFSATGFMVSATGYAQDTEQQKINTIRQKMEEKNYVFIPQMVYPLSGMARPVTPDFELRVSPDRIVSALPYFGRAFVAPTNPAEGGIRFNSTAFDYSASQKKKGKWEISIKPRDVQGAQQLFLTVFEDGTARLQVSSTNRQSISFGGYIAEK